MSTNDELAVRFADAAALLEVTGANKFKVNALARVARTLESLTTDVATIADDPKALAAIDGIGASSAKKIAEYVERGTIAEFDALRSEVPDGLVDLLELPGLGPKSVRTLWKDGGITDLTGLEDALADDTLADLPRMGAKTLANLRDAIEFRKKGAGRTRIGPATEIAEAIAERLRTEGGASRVEIAGSLRRGRETIGDLDLLATAADRTKLVEAFTSFDGVEKVLLSGDTKTSLRLDRGIQVDLRVVEPAVFGAALLYFTGSKEHNVRLRERAQGRSMRLNEYGLFPDDGDDAPPQNRGVEPIAAGEEAEIYAALDLPWIPPELREDRGETELTEVPPLVELGQIGSELHAHTNESDGKLTLREFVEEARRRGLHTIAVTDHSRSSVQANGLSVERLLRQIDEIRAIDAEYDDITVLAGSEVDILVDGRLDYEDDVLAQLDVVVASPHASLRQDPETATKRLLAAIAHPLVHVLGHPTGRLINEREGLAPDIDALIAAAVEHRTALEINANPWRLDLRDHHVRAAARAGALVTIDTDAHSAAGFDVLRYGVQTARRGWLPPEQCPNTWNAARLREWLASKR